MKLLPLLAGGGRTSVSVLAGLLLALTLIPVARAQTPDAPPKPAESKADPETVETFYLSHATAQNDLNDVQAALRNMLPRAKLYSSQSQNAISIRANAEEMQLAKKMISDLDRPRKAWRVTYTITEIDDGKRIGEQHLALLVVAGGKTFLKHGNRVPIVTGMYDKENASPSSQIQYLDVGLNIEASLDGDRLRSKIEESAVADEKSGIGAQDPVVRQTMLESVSDIIPGKSLVLGSLDIPGTTRRQEITASTESVQ